MSRTKCVKGRRGVALVGAIVSAGILGGASEAWAARIGADNAGDAAYTTGFVNGATGFNGGSGFGAWVLSGTTSGNTSFNGAFVGDSNTNGSSGGPGINTGGRAWGLYGNSQNIQNAVRPFTADSNGATALTVGQTLTFQIDNGNINSRADNNGGNGSGPNSAGSVGVSLQTSTGANRFELFFGGGSNGYSINDSTSNNVNTGLGFTDGGLSVSFTLVTSSTYSVTITRLAGGTPVTRQATLIGSPATADISQIRFFNFSAGSGNAANAYANSISITKPVISITSGIPTAYGSQLGSLAVTGGSGNYTLAQATGLTGSTGYLRVSGFSPTTDREIYALQVLVNGAAPTSAQLTQLATAIGSSASTTSPVPGVFGSNYNLFLNFAGTSLPTGSQPYYLGYDFSTAAQSLGGVTISAVAVIPEPTGLAVLGLLGLPMLRRNRR